MRKVPFLLLTLLAGVLLRAADAVTVPFLKCDGKPGSVLNAAVPEKSGFVRGLPRGGKADVQTHVKMFHDGKYLYLGVRCDEPAMDKLAAAPERVPQKIWANDTIEFNYDPDGRNQALGKIFVDTAGNIVDMFGYDDNTGSDRFTLEFCRKSRTKLISLVKNADNWTVELAIPLGVFYAGTKKDKLAPRINIARNRRSAEREGSDLFQMGNNHNQPRLYPEFRFDKLDFSEFGCAVENLSIASDKSNGVFTAAAKARLLSPAKRFRNIKVTARLLNSRGEALASGETIAALLPGTLVEAKVPLKPQKLGRCKLEWEVCELSGTLLSAQTMDVELSYSPVSIKVTDPPYRNNIYATMPEVRTVRAEVRLAEGHGKPLTVTLTGPDYQRSVAIASAQAVNQVEFPFENAKEGTYTMKAGDVTATIRKLPHHPGEVWLDKDGVVHVDGKKFLPFGQSYATADWKPRGVTVTETPAIWKSKEQLKTYLDKLQAAGIKVKLYPYYVPDPKDDVFTHEARKAGKLSDKQKARIKEMVDIMKDHPAVLAYYAADEPEGWGENEDFFIDLLAYLQELDPYHPVTICNYGTDGQRRFHRGCDVLFPDTYPNYFQDNSTTLPRRANYDHAVHASKLRPAWMSLHGFDWGKKSPTGAASRAPTYDEMREQLFSAFLGNVRGVTYYAFPNWGTYSYQLRIGKEYLGPEVDSLKDFLLAPTEFPVKASGNFKPDDFLCGVKRCGNEFIIITVNLSDKPCDVVFESSLKLPAKLAVVGEKCSVATQNGRTFRDRVEPHTARVYATPKVECDAVDMPKVRQMIREADASRRRPGNLAAAGELSYSQMIDYQNGVVPPNVPKITCSGQLPPHRKGQATQYFLQDGIRETGQHEQMTWTPDPNDKAPWLEIDFGKAVTVGRSVFYTGGPAPTFGLLIAGRLLAEENGSWREVASFTGNKLPVLELKFAPVRTQKLRLEITRVEHPWKRLMHEWEVYEK